MKVTYRFVVTDAYLSEAETLALSQNPVVKFMYLKPWGSTWLPVMLFAGVGVWSAFYYIWELSVAMLLPIAFSLLGRYLSVRSRTQARQKNQLLNTEATISVGDDGIDSVTAHSKSHMEWAGVTQAILDPKGILLRISVGFQWLPDANIEAGSPNAARRLINDHVRRGGGRKVA
jgi:hypothetical protein